MTQAPPPASSASSPVGQLCVWDTSPLHHAIKADKIDLLADMARTWNGAPRRNVTTQAVLDEISHYGLPLAGLDWLEVVHVDHLEELAALVKWMDLVSGQNSNHGEATVLAWAEVHGAVAVVDDGDARRIARRAGLEVWGSLRVIAEAVKESRATEYAANVFVDALMDSGMFCPCQRGQFINWAKQMGLL